jgi:transposase-like protein
VSLVRLAGGPTGAARTAGRPAPAPTYFLRGVRDRGLPGEFPAVAQLLRDAKADITASADFPLLHWRKDLPTNPLERLHREVKRRTAVVGVVPNPACRPAS